MQGGARVELDLGKAAFLIRKSRREKTAAGLDRSRILARTQVSGTILSPTAVQGYGEEAGGGRHRQTASLPHTSH